MFKDYCFLYRKLPKDTIEEAQDLFKKGDDSDSDKGVYKKQIDPIRDEFRIYKSKELRVDEIMKEGKKAGYHQSLFKYDPDDDGFLFGLEMAMKIHKRVNLFQ